MKKHLNKLFHHETIKCPECNRIQTAVVEHALPFDIYVHTCEKCGYVIMEREWEIVKADIKCPRCKILEDKLNRIWKEVEKSYKLASVNR